jgi:hypothetical protein
MFVVIGFICLGLTLSVIFVFSSLLRNALFKNMNLLENYKFNYKIDHVQSM